MKSKNIKNVAMYPRVLNDRNSDTAEREKLFGRDILLMLGVFAEMEKDSLKRRNQRKFKI
ncbi:MAG: hypothetical protein UR50_C0003G0029 [Parcubacteria group bacterium GW2011_GWC1_34_10]|uniref:Uncharacterized protein n=1 Tax=Candidatus Zambryskibacteria bacterium RIFCSPLOWO2_01_FULL_35_19 TaxID=1802757 RepID=A0A1G2U0H8_9BACT|nr:MAG: hypothetical protein UR50_C0003G0029 [Parcubacteria group bacterium GW2011_GWC1_34_10]OHA86726.1 MAG: hypothetical protein A2726_00105 [Candidatus Zambryskibacteria bacterium RIFCSPHIGHO2_01_FULL_35_32]OHB02332.1 MAG: hypothetical protein A3A90_00865 [Candidatus Zambryskibacteria bacterium RIFCSPLOWO2_01_FULL_35_19]